MTADDMTHDIHNLCTNKIYQIDWNITTYHFKFILFACYDIARISPVTGIEKRQSQISDFAVRKCLKLHTKILDLRIIWFNHDGALLCDDVTEPATMEVREFAVNETHPSATTAPRCFDHQARRIGQALLHRLDGSGFDGDFEE